MEPTDVCYKYNSATDEAYLYIADSSNDAIRKVLICQSGSIIKDALVETINIQKIPSVVEVVKSNMVQCGANGCKFIRRTPVVSKTEENSIVVETTK